MPKMGSHCSFGHLKHKLWAKERSGVKLAVWLPTTKSRESTWFTWLQTTCHIPLESSRRELQLCFRSDFNSRSVRKVMGLQSLRSPRWRDFGTPPRESRERKTIWMQAPWRGTEYTIRGKGGFPKSGPWWVKWVQGCPWFVLAPKVFQLCTNHFVRVLCKPVWVSEACQLFLVPSRSSNLPLYPSKGCDLGSVPQLLLLSLFSYLGPHLGPLKSWECVKFTWSFSQFVTRLGKEVLCSGELSTVGRMVVANFEDRARGIDGVKNRSGKCEGPGGGDWWVKEPEWVMWRTGRGRLMG
jgi:hypothetical protein